MSDQPPAAAPAANGSSAPQDPMALVHKILAQMPGMVASALASALQQAPARSGLMCAQCLIARGQWEAAHIGELRAAHAMALDEAGIAGTDPRAGGLDLTRFLRPGLLPGGSDAAPPQFDACVMVAGTGYCAAHTPGNPAAAAVGAQGSLIQVPAGVGVHAAYRIATTAQGLPGVPEGVVAGLRG
jgi:hypothetical protein